jgi:hypothetical protein
MNKMRKLSMISLAIILTLISCADSKELVVDGKKITVEPYGWADADVNKIEGVEYQVNFGNVVWSVIGVETVIVPIWLTGWELFEPVKVKDTAK